MGEADSIRRGWLRESFMVEAGFDLGPAGLRSLDPMAIMGQIGLGAEHSRGLGYGGGAASLKEQGF